MCLYETEMINQKYVVNKKNKGNIPILKDKRQKYIKTGCGWCKECRKKIANDWKIRLYNEDKKNAQFVSLSLSVESIIELEKEIYKTQYKGISEYNEETDVNLLTSFAVRRWTERWRKFEKKAPRHFLITELGHRSSERIHLHGIVWGTKEMINKTWKYGNVDIGEWVDNRTINYITKYITKIDQVHKGYKQAIFVSKGLGAEYIEKNKDYHKFKGKDTRTKYKLENGMEVELPRYYKEKLWTDEEREKLWTIKLDENKVILEGEEIKNISLEEFNKKLETVRNDNKRCGYGDNKTIVKKYIITEAMKTPYRKLSEKIKKVKCVDKRTIEKTTTKKEGTTISKSNLNERYIYGEYIGTTTETQRKYNELLKEANERKISVRTLRLIKAGIIPDTKINL